MFVNSSTKVETISLNGRLHKPFGDEILPSKAQRFPVILGAGCLGTERRVNYKGIYSLRAIRKVFSTIRTCSWPKVAWTR